MTNPSSPIDSPRCLRIGLDWRWHRPKPRAGRPRGEPREEDRPLRCDTAGRPCLHRPISCPSLTANSMLSTATLYLPMFGTTRGWPTSWRGSPPRAAGCGSRYRRKDHWLCSTHSTCTATWSTSQSAALRPFETADIGWRRHYSEGDLALLFGPRRLHPGHRAPVRPGRLRDHAAERVRALPVVAAIARWLHAA